MQERGIGRPHKSWAQICHENFCYAFHRNRSILSPFCWQIFCGYRLERGGTYLRPLVYLLPCATLVSHIAITNRKKVWEVSFLPPMRKIRTPELKQVSCFLASPTPLIAFTACTSGAEAPAMSWDFGRVSEEPWGSSSHHGRRKGSDSLSWFNPSRQLSTTQPLAHSTPVTGKKSSPF